MSAMPTGSARVAGVTGWPVHHSLSPRLHGFWLARHGIDGVYAPFAIRPEAFASAIGGLCAAGLRGVSVTVPHKLAAHRLATDLDEAARATGAVNLLLFGEAGAIEGRNTDVPGFMANLAAHGVDVGAGPVLLFGAGGAARAAAAGLLAAGAPEIRLVNRSPESALALCATLADARLDYLGAEATDKAAADVALVVNASSLGMGGKGAPALNLAALPEAAIVHDIVYTPLETPLLGAARARGLSVVDGLGMLLHQAVPAFEAFYGVRPEVDQALRDHMLAVG